jgi:hypothetical protein
VAPGSQRYGQLIRREVIERILRRHPITVSVANLLENDHPFFVEEECRWREPMGYVEDTAKRAHAGRLLDGNTLYDTHPEKKLQCRL